MKHRLIVLLCLLLYHVSSSGQEQKITVTGVVTEAETGIPIPGANIVEKGTTNGATTDFDGVFEITVPPRAVLQISYLGFSTFEFNLEGETEIAIELNPEASALDQVVVVGYGKQKKVSVVGAISTVEPEKLRVATGNVSNALAGNLAGVIAMQRSGQPGADASTFFIRGISTFSGAQNPLILLDGVAISAGDLNALAPEVIESVSVLKDASATAIYGTRGANGVLIVTTKTGRNLDKPRIYTRMQSQISFPTSLPEFADGPEYMELFNEAITNRRTGEILYTQDQIDGTREGRDPYVYPNVDWYDELFNKFTFNQEANVNVQGGGERVGYFMSGTYNRATGLLKNFDINSYDSNIAVEKFSFQNNIDAELSPTTKVALKLNTQLRYEDGPASGASAVFGSIMNGNPIDFPMYFPQDENADPRNILMGGKSGGLYNNSYQNPFALMTNGYIDNFQSTVLATFDAEQKLDFITEGLQFKGLVSFKNWSSTTATRTRGYNLYEINNYSLNDQGEYIYDLAMIGQEQNLSLSTSTGTTGDRSLYFQPTLEYVRNFGAHNVTGLLLYNQTEYNYNAPSDLITSLPERRMGYAGRVTYDFDNRYLLEANFAYNGSENFAKNKRFGFFPSFGGGYVISNENWYGEELRDVVDLLKVRFTWGKVGNDRIGGARFPYLSNINLSGRGYTTGRDMNTYRAGPTYLQFANEDITWETATKIDIGLEVGLFKELDLVLDFYRELREDIFVDVSTTIPSIFGTAGTLVYSNIGEVENKGFDLSLQYTKQFGDDFTISSRGTFTFARNEVLKNNEPPFTQFPNLSAVGYPIGTLLGYKAERLFIDQAEVDNSPSQQLGGFVGPGDIKYTDITGDGIINSDDRIRMGYPTTPEIIYGLSTTMNYKKWDFSFLLQGAARTSFFINGFHPFGTSGIRNVMKWIEEDHYGPSNPDIYAGYPALSKMDNGNNTVNSSFWLRDGSFLKLRSAEIGYNHSIGRIFLSGYNLLTFSKFDLWDPEQGGGNGLGYPTQTIVNLGVQLRFN